MRVRRNKKNATNITKSTNENPILHNKTSSMDKRSTSKSKNIYLNKILEQNLGIQNMEESMIQKNIPNFESSIQNILSNEE